MFERLWVWDEEIYHAIHVGWRSPAMDVVMKLITDTGLGWVQGLILLGVFLWKPQWRPAVWCVFLSGVLCGILRLPLMKWVDRMRPSNFQYASPLEQIFGNTSYPSGHTATSFAIAFAVWFLVRGTRFGWLGPALFVWACLVGFSRIYVGVHYLSDVIGGAAFGLIAAVLFSLLHRARQAKRAAKQE